MSFKAPLSVFMKIVVCSMLATTKDVPKEGGSPVEGYRISLSASRAEYHFGEPILLHVKLENVTQHVLPLHESSVDPYDFDLVLPVLRHVPLTLWGRQQEDSLKKYFGLNATIELKPGEGESFDYSELNRKYDMTLEGQYTVSVRRRFQSLIDRDATINVISNPVTISVISPAAPSPATRPAN